MDNLKIFLHVYSASSETQKYGVGVLRPQNNSIVTGA